MSVQANIKLRFDRICEEEILGCRKTRDSIGTYSEKRLHIALKRFVCDLPECYEIRVTADKTEDSVAGVDEKGKKRRSSSYVADVKQGNEIYEIQTASFYPLRNKIAFYLEKTDNFVTIVHPLAAIKWVSWIDTETGDISKRNRSPKKESVRSIARDLYCIEKYLGHPRLKILLPLIELEEYRNLDGWGKGRKRGSTRYERFPLRMLDCITLSTPSDYKEHFLPDTLPESFTASAYAKETGIKGISTYSALSALCALGHLKKGEKVGRSYVYERS